MQHSGGMWAAPEVSKAMVSPRLSPAAAEADLGLPLNTVRAGTVLKARDAFTMGDKRKMRKRGELCVP